MAGRVTINFNKAVLRVSRRWIVAALGLTGVVWIVGLACALAVAGRVHDDVPVALAAKLPLLRLQPQLIFAGDSRTLYQVDAGLAAQLRGKAPGYAVNIAYDAGEPLSLLAAIRKDPARFKDADLVVSVALLVLNEGVFEATVFPQDVTARLGVFNQLATFLPLRIGTLIRFIREAFNARLAVDQNIAVVGPLPADYGLIRLHARADYRWPANLSSHAHYANWNLSGPKAGFEIGALCDMVAMTRSLTVVLPPWATRYDRAADPVWRTKDDEAAALVASAGRRCGFVTLNLQTVPGLAQENFADELHVNQSGIPIYTRYLMTQLKP
jgi:hypothetical protein